MLTIFRSITRRGFMALAFLAALAAMPGSAQAGKINTTMFSGVAIEGTDPVAYFTEGRVVEGKETFTAEWGGAKWRFASAANLAAFQAAPEKYAPQFGGYCAWAVSRGYTASIDPEAWKIVDGKLYLNYSKSVQSQWVEDIPGNIVLGNKNWPGLKAKL